MRVETTNICGGVYHMHDCWQCCYSYAGILRRSQGNYKVSFHCTNLLYLAKQALVNRTWCTQMIKKIPRVNFCQFVFRAFTEAVVSIQTCRARIKVLYFLLLTRLWDFCAILSNVRQTFSTNPALVNNSVCLRAHIYRPWPNYMAKQLLKCSLLLSYVRHECHFINRATLFFICTEDLADLPIFIVELLNILFSGLP